MYCGRDMPGYRRPEPGALRIAKVRVFGPGKPWVVAVSDGACLIDGTGPVLVSERGSDHPGYREAFDVVFDA